MNKLPIVAAVPNYNMGQQLNPLLRVLMEHGYDDIYVLDDASTDDSRDVTRSISSDIHFVAGSENKGAGGNRNRIIPVLGHEAIVHFIDADMDPTCNQMADRVKEALPSSQFGFIGGLINDLNGRQMVYNFGPRQSLRNDISSMMHLGLYALGNKKPDLEASLRDKYANILQGWPDTSKPPQRQKAFWTAEANLVVNSRLFSLLDGFDESLRDHEIQDLAIRMDKLGLERTFDPILSATHTAAQVREGDRNFAMFRAEAAIARKHGIRNWISGR